MALWTSSPGGDNSGELVLKETFTHSHLSWSSIIPYLLPISFMTDGIVLVQFTCLTVFFHNLSPIFLWSTSWPSTLHFTLNTFLHPIIVFFSCQQKWTRKSVDAQGPYDMPQIWKITLEDLLQEMMFHSVNYIHPKWKAIYPIRHTSCKSIQYLAFIKVQIYLHAWHCYLTYKVHCILPLEPQATNARWQSWSR